MWLMPTSPIPRLSHWLCHLWDANLLLSLIKSETGQTLNHFSKEDLWQTKRRLVRTRFAVVRHSRTENIAAPRVKAPAKPLNLIAIADTPSVPAIFNSSWFFLKNERGA